jgi:hypothetical protein
MQLDLWSALQPQYDTFEAAAGEHPRAFISKAQPTRAPAQVPAGFIQRSSAARWW